MKIRSNNPPPRVIAPVFAFLFLGTTAAQAEYHSVSLDHGTHWTFIWCATILAGGMIIAASILRRPK